MSHTKGISSTLKQVVQLVGVGLVLGFLFGAGKGLLAIDSNRYLDLGMYNIAFHSLRSTINYLSLLFPVAFATIFLTFSLLTMILKKVSAEKHLYFAIPAIILLGSFLFTGYHLNQGSWYPAFFSVKGFSYNAAVTVAFTLLGGFWFKLRPRILHFPLVTVLKMFPVRLAWVPVGLLVVLNGLFYYHNFHADKGGMNVLWITIDTLRADHLGSYGYKRDVSPNIDQLAEEGIQFSQAIVQWPKTTPSFASMLTSTYPYYNGMTQQTQKLSDHFVLLPEILKNAQYRTVSVVTNGNLAAAYNFDQGSDTHIETWREFKSTDAEHVTDYALSWLSGNAERGQFYMWLHYLDPHAVYEPPSAYSEMYVGDEYYDDSRRAPLSPDETRYEMGQIPPLFQLGNHDEVDYYVAEYDAEIRYMDANVGRVLDTINELGLADNTIIIFTADHGESLGDHNYYFGHGRLPYDATSRVPLIIKIPHFGSEASRIEEPVELINIMPTVLDLLGIPIKGEAQGTSLVPLMQGNSANIPKYVFTEAGQNEHHQRVVRTQKWKLIYIPDEDDRQLMQGLPFELYDIESDPNELTNLIDVETETADLLKKELFEWMADAKRMEDLPTQENVRLDSETESLLRSLGYIQ